MPRDGTDEAWLQALVADWQILADLSFADLVLWVADEAVGWRAVAQVRPTTGPTTLAEEVVGEVQHDPPPSAVPVRHGDRTLALLERKRAALRHAGDLESAYVEASDALLDMVSAGLFPQPGPDAVSDTLRVGDGFIRLGPDGVVRFASPNAMSVYRRLGLRTHLVGAHLADVTAEFIDDRPTERAVRGVLAGRVPADAEIVAASATVFVRVIPLRRGGVGDGDGAMVLMRDVTELRLRERELVSKEATIREIHHRVKNNLQTVAALLRLQSRRSDAPEAREALAEAERRVGSIAIVHETLSRSFDETVDFDDICDRLLRSVLDVSSSGVRGERIGTFGALPGSVATPLAMALTELIQNALQHAFIGAGGRLTISVNRIRDRLRLRVSDDGVGLPAHFSPDGSLGLSIVSTLVVSELGGSLNFEARPGQGTTVAIELGLA